VIDVTEALDAIPVQRWPLRIGDPLISHLESVVRRVNGLRVHSRRIPLGEVALSSPIANPGKIMAAPANYPRPHRD